MTRLKALVLAAVVLAAVAVGTSASAARVPARGGRELVSLNLQVADAINAFRVAHGLSVLQVSTDLNAAARQHSLEMGAVGYFDHPSANGTAFWKRIQSYYASGDYSYWTVGENLLYSTPTVSATEAMRMWIASPEHRRNLMSKTWVDLGVSSVHVRRAPGVYEGYPVTIVSTDFGARH